MAAAYPRGEERASRERPALRYAQPRISSDPMVAPAIPLLRNRVEADIAANVIAQERKRRSLCPLLRLQPRQNRRCRLFAGRRVRTRVADDLLGGNEQTDERSGGIHDKSPLGLSVDEMHR